VLGQLRPRARSQKALCLNTNLLGDEARAGELTARPQ